MSASSWTLPSRRRPRRPGVGVCQLGNHFREGSIPQWELGIVVDLQEIERPSESCW